MEQIEYKVQFTQNAIYDLQRIKLYLDGFDPSIFISLFGKLKQRIRLLQFQPHIAEVFLILKGYEFRKIIIKNYVVIYYVNDRSKVVQIHSVFHCSEDYYNKIFIS